MTSNRQNRFFVYNKIPVFNYATLEKSINPTEAYIEELTADQKYQSQRKQLLEIGYQEVAGNPGSFFDGHNQAVYSLQDHKFYFTKYSPSSADSPSVDVQDQPALSWVNDMVRPPVEGRRFILDANEYLSRFGSCEHLIFSQNGEHSAARVRTFPAGTTIAHDGNAWKNYCHQFSRPFLNKNGKTVAAVGINANSYQTGMGKSFNVLINDMAMGKIYPNELKPQMLSPDGKLFINILDNDKQQLVVNGTLFRQEINNISAVTLSPEGKIVMAVKDSYCENGFSSKIILGNEEIYEIDSCLIQTLVASPNGEEYAAIIKNGEIYPGLNIRRETNYGYPDGIWSHDKIWNNLCFTQAKDLTFSPDSARLAALIKSHDNYWTVAVDEVDWPISFANAKELVWSLDGKHLATIVEAQDPQKQFLPVGPKDLFKQIGTIAINGKLLNTNFFVPNEKALYNLQNLHFTSCGQFVRFIACDDDLVYYQITKKIW